MHVLWLAIKLIAAAIAVCGVVCGVVMIVRGDPPHELNKDVELIRSIFK